MAIVNNIKKIQKKSIVEYIILAVIILVIFVLFLGFGNKEFSYKRYETSTLDYIKGRVVTIIDENLEDREQYKVGSQLVNVEILEGELRGKEIKIENHISATHNVILKQGNRVIVCADMPEGIEPFYSIYNYDRGGTITFVVICFILLVILVGKKKGFMSCIGLFFTLCMVICYLLPALYAGKNAILAALVTICLSTVVSCFCISGLHRKTLLNILSTVAGCICAGIIYKIFMAVLNITVSSIEEIESLVLITQSTGLKLHGVLFAGIMISSLGAVMDIAVSMGASLGEIKELNPKITPKELFRSGMNIGRDMIGTMTNTLILAFAGGALATLLILISYGVQTNQLLSSDFIALELAQGLAGSAAVILTVPIGAMVCAIGYGTQ